MQIAYTNGLSVPPEYDICGMALVYPIHDDPVKEKMLGPMGGVTIKFLQTSVEKGRAISNYQGYFVVLLPAEGTYDIVIDDPRFVAFSRTITLTAGSRAPYVGYILELVDAGTWDDLIITPPELREEFLFGLRLVDTNGNPYPDTAVAKFIRKCQGQFEIHCDVDLLYRKVWAGVTEPPDPENWDVIEPGYDYDFRDLMQWTYLKLRRKPIWKPVDNLELVYPVGLSVFKLPKEWIRTYFMMAQLQVVPTAGAINRIFMLPGGQYTPLVSWYLPGQIPQVYKMTYEVGMVNTATGERNTHIPRNVIDLARHIVALQAAIEVLGVAGDAVLAGIASQSISGDGLSESYSTTASATSATFQARIESYRKDLFGRSAGEPGMYQKFKDYFAGISLVVA